MCRSNGRKKALGNMIIIYVQARFPSFSIEVIIILRISVHTRYNSKNIIILNAFNIGKCTYPGIDIRPPV